MSEITIRMPKALLAGWLAALRGQKMNPKTGKPFTQGFERLETTRGDHCCLGVLQMVADGAVELTHLRLPGSFPSSAWYSAHGITIGDGAGGSAIPYLPTLDALATEANDSCKYGFGDIADAIEACAEGI